MPARCWMAPEMRLDWFDEFFISNGITRQLRAESEDGSLIPNVEVRSTLMGNKIVAFICLTSGPESVTVNLKRDGKLLAGRDLISNNQVKSPTVLKLNQPILIEISKDQ